jgi:hypothetical protein
MRKEKEGFAVPSDTEWSTYEVILPSSRLGARPNPPANWKHAIFYYWVVGDPERSEQVFGGSSTYKLACRQRLSVIAGAFIGSSLPTRRHYFRFGGAQAEPRARHPVAVEPCLTVPSRLALYKRAVTGFETRS